MFSLKKMFFKAAVSGAGAAIATSTAVHTTGNSDKVEEAALVVATAILSALFSAVKNWLKNRNK